MALLTRKRVILIEAENSYSIAPTMVAADAVLVRDLSITPQSSDVVSRELIRPYLGASEQLLANTRVECTFAVELCGSGTAGEAPRYGDALKACGMSETVVASTRVTYAPVSSSFSSFGRRWISIPLCGYNSVSNLAVLTSTSSWNFCGVSSRSRL